MAFFTSFSTPLDFAVAFLGLSSAFLVGYLSNMPIESWPIFDALFFYYKFTRFSVLLALFLVLFYLTFVFQPVVIFLFAAPLFYLTTFERKRRGKVYLRYITDYLAKRFARQVARHQILKFLYPSLIGASAAILLFYDFQNFILFVFLIVCVAAAYRRAVIWKMRKYQFYNMQEFLIGNFDGLTFLRVVIVSSLLFTGYVESARDLSGVARFQYANSQKDYTFLGINSQGLILIEKESCNLHIKRIEGMVSMHLASAVKKSHESASEICAIGRMFMQIHAVVILVFLIGVSEILNIMIPVASKMLTKLPLIGSQLQAILARRRKVSNT